VTDLVIDAVDLSRTFDDGVGVRGVDISVGMGEIHALVGLNGAGKSTLMRLLLGMLRPHSGRVAIGGRSIADADWAQVGHLVEYPLAYGELTVRQNLALGARLHQVASADIPSMVERVVADLDLKPYGDRRARKLSLGNRQRLGLASALQHDPHVIVLDEPTNALDPNGVILVRERLLHCASKGAGVLVSSHHLDEVARIADRISVLNNGRIIGILDPQGVDIERSFFELVHEDDDRTPVEVHGGVNA
jgi:ABC-2 type transport system ATP-binding protein